MGIGVNGLSSGLNDTYSALLGGGAGSGEVGGASLLSDYASIKNGSYGKMMKSYYAKVKESEEEEGTSKSSKTKEKDAASASAARKFYETATGMSALDYSADNIDELYDKVSAFVKDYNSMMKAASKSSNSEVKAQADALNDYTYQNYKLFSKVGITMNADRTLSIDEDTFKKVNEKTGATTVPTLTTLFKGIGSFADKAADRASTIYRKAGEGEDVTSAKAKYAGSTGSISSGDKTDNSDKTTSKTAKDAASAASASALYKSVEKLGAMIISDDNKDNVFDVFSTLVKDYNELLKDTADSKNSNVIKQADSLKSLISSNKSAFSRLGITVNSDKSLSIDEEKFMEADMSTAKSLFSGAYSFGEKMTDRINQIYRYATQGDSLNGQTYTSRGSYSAAGVGSTLDTVM